MYSLDQIHLDRWTWTSRSNGQLDQNDVFLGPILVGPGLFLVRPSFFFLLPENQDIFFRQVERQDIFFQTK